MIKIALAVAILSLIISLMVGFLIYVGSGD